MIALYKSSIARYLELTGSVYQSRIMAFKLALSLVLLVVSSLAMLKSTDQSKLASVSLTHTHYLLNLSKSVQTGSYEHKALVALYLRTRDNDSFTQMHKKRDSISEKLTEMQLATAGNAAQQRQVKAIISAFKAVVSESESQQPRMGGLVMNGPTISIIGEGQIDSLNAVLIARLNAFDEDLQRLSEAQQHAASQNSRSAEMVMLASLLTGIGILLMTFMTLRNEVTRRKESEERWQFALEGGGNGVWDWSLATNKTYYSVRWWEIHGYDTNPGGSGMDVWERHIHPEDLQDVLKKVQEYFDGKAPIYASDHRIVCKDGSIRWVHEQGMVPLRDKDGKPQRMIGTLMDITERKLMETTLLENEKRLRFMLEKSPIAVRIARAGGREVIFANARYAALINVVIGHVYGADPESYYADKEVYEEILAKLGNGEEIFDKLVELIIPGYGTKWTLASYVRIQYEGEPAVLGWFYDITERKQAEVELKIAASIFDCEIGMLITDANNKIIRANKAFTRITGYTSEEVIGKTPALLNSGRQDNDFYQSMWRSIEQAGTWEGEIWNRRKNGEVYPEYLTISAVRSSDGTVSNYAATFTDISSSKAAADEIRNLAFFDPLTGLPNRRLLLDRLSQAMASSSRSGKEGALLFIDLDNFKELNDTLGHDVGDKLLKEVAKRLAASVREGDTVARLGGDEFVVMVEDLSGKSIEAAAQVEMVGDKIIAALNQPYFLDTHECRNTPSIGATLFNTYKSSIDELLKQADIAMYQSKTAGRNQLRFFDPKMQESINARVSLEAELRKAIESRQFLLHYQVQVDKNGRPSGAEALIRWAHPERGIVSPAHFISLAEDSGIILPMGEWVLDTACAQLKAWQSDPLTEDILLAVNVSPRQFRQPDFADQVLSAVTRHDIAPCSLKLELTESLFLEDIGEVITTMNTLHGKGIQFSLDDFGTGYSSLQYLKRLPLNQLKIDQSFVRDIVSDSSDREIVGTIIAMAKNLKLSVIAEGVETEEQLQLLKDSGCLFFQGYLFSKPLPLDEFELMFKEKMRA